MKMKGTILALVIVGFAAVASAAVLNVGVTLPTSNTDGSAIPATGPGSISSVRMEYGSCNGSAFGTKIGEFSGSPGALATPNLAPGTYCFRGYPRNTFGNEGAVSNVFAKTVEAPTPNPLVITGVN